jgi:hypothetical protein
MLYWFTHGIQASWICGHLPIQSTDIHLIQYAGTFNISIWVVHVVIYRSLESFSTEFKNIFSVIQQLCFLSPAFIMSTCGLFLCGHYSGLHYYHPTYIYTVLLTYLLTSVSCLCIYGVLRSFFIWCHVLAIRN